MLAAAMTAGLPAAGHVPSSTAEIRAEAVAQPSVVLLVTQWRGYVHIPGVSHWLKSKATTTCSGFVANPSGYVVTAGHCVDNQSMLEGGKLALIDTLLARYVSHGAISAEQAALLKRDTQVNGDVEGLESGSPPDRKVLMFQPSTTVGQSLDNGLTAQVVAFKGLSDGDVALLKVQSPSPMAALQVAPQAPDNGTEIVAAGYPGSVSDVTDTQIEPSFKSGSISSTRTVSGVPYTEISAPITPGMSGGPAFDMRGRVVGTVSFNPSEEHQSFNFITDTNSVRAILSQNGVSNKLGAADTAYRQGLSDYWAGHYHAAATEFGKVVTLDSDQATAREFQSKAVANYPNEVSSGTSMWLWIGIGAAVLVAAGLITGLMIRRRRARPGGRGPGTTGGGPAPAPPTGAAMVPPPAQVPPLVPTAPPAGSQPMQTVPPAPETPWQGQAPPLAPTQATPPTAVAAAMPVSGHDGDTATRHDGETARGRDGETAGREQESAGHFCPECGSPHPPDAHFCASCGHRFPAHIN